MNVASLELCRELYELAPDWLGAPSECVSSSCSHHAYYDNGRFICPKYDLGYLLRKLPGSTKVGANGNGWEAIDDAHAMFGFGPTPEDAACKLAIELIKQGVIKV